MQSLRLFHLWLLIFSGILAAVSYHSPSRSDAEEVKAPPILTEQRFLKGEKIDLNQATRSELMALPGVGIKLANQIIARRPYQTIDQLLRVRGLGPKKLAGIRPRVVVTSNPSR